MSYWVYIHTCKANGKKYVGCTTRVKPELRWREGNGYQYNKYFYSAIQKYGWSNFEHEAWELTCKSEMYYAEKYLIAYYHTTESEFGYNHSSGGEKSSLGCKHSEEYRKKLSEAHKGKVLSLEHRKRISETLKKRCSDPEVRKKMAESQKKKWSDLELRKRVSEALKGKTRSEEVRKHTAEAVKKSHSDSRYKKKMSEIAKNRSKVKIKLPDGTIVEMSKSHIVRWYINKGKKFEYVD